MALWDEVQRRQAIEIFPRELYAGKGRESLQLRAIDSFTSMPGLEDQLLAIQGLTSRPWRFPSVGEALGVPSIFRAVSLIANTVGRLNLEAFRNGAKLPQDQTPVLIRRPDPFRKPRDFFRDTAFYLATRGEAWWYVAKRDTDNAALSLIVVPPWEIEVIPNPADRLRPTIKWLNKEIPRTEMRQITFLPDGYRGIGPLQVCGAAASVAVESQEWAANFYAKGGYPSILIKAADELGEAADGEQEADKLKAQWTDDDPNTPKVIDQGIESVTELGAKVESAQMLLAREHNDGDAARMFGIPGALLEYAQSGTSLTYQNVADVWRQFQEGCLTPNYLEPIEQEMSDLLTRSTVARFNIKGLLRADIKTRFEAYNVGVPLGVITAEEARMEEGYAPGDVEYAPVPFSPPTAYPDRLPINRAAAVEPAYRPVPVPEPERVPPARPGPAPIVTRAQVLTARARLQAQGKPYGYDSLARELGVSRDTIRRRLLTASPERAA